jgi:quinol monooxygenase YgiN
MSKLQYICNHQRGLMVEYEVTITISSDILDEYIKWLKEHIEDMLKIDGFISSKYYRVDVLDKHIVCVRYLVQSKKHLQNYIDNQSKAMRSSFKEEFKDKFEISRRVLVEGDI